MALAAYRHVLRSTRIAFQGDPRLLQASRAQTRSAFQESRSLSPETPEVQKAIQHAEEVAKILRHNIVQGERVNPGKGGEEQAETIRLRIHDDIERGDNSTVKMPDGKTINVQPGCS